MVTSLSFLDRLRTSVLRFGDHAVLLVAAAIASAIGFAIVQAMPVLSKELHIFRGWETAPVALYMASTALSSWYSKRLAKYFGETFYFLAGAVLAAIGVTIGLAVLANELAMAIAGAIVIVGLGLGTTQMYKFAAARVVQGGVRGKLLSAYTYATLVAALAGPAIVGISRSSEGAWPVKLFAILAGMAIALVTVCWIFHRISLFDQHSQSTGRSDTAADRSADSRNATHAILLGVLANSVMSLLMVASSLYMYVCGVSSVGSALAFQVHFLAMFGPSLITGQLLDRFGVRVCVVMGTVLNLIAGVIAYKASTFIDFFWFLLLCGLAWNLIFLSSQYVMTNALSTRGKDKFTGRYQAAVTISTCVAVLMTSPLQAAYGWTAVASLALALSTAILFTSLILKTSHERTD